MCGFHPVECPNTCGASPQRQNLEQHASNDCPLTVISCDFQCVGCEVRLPRKAMSDHLNENTVTHVNQLLGYVKNQNLTFCKEQDKSQEQIAGLRNAQDQSHREIGELKKYQNLMQKCISETWPLLLWIILPAVVAVVGISIEEVNSLEQHLEEQMGLIANIPEELLPLIMKDNWLEQELQRKEEFFGELTKNMTRLEQELQRKEELFGGLTEKVSKLEQELQRKEELFGGLTEKIKRLEREEDIQHTFIYMPNFETRKEASEPWDSQPFYSHPSLGYKMCLRVYANGARYRKGTHVSVRMYLMRGEFDDHLKWPFRADITIELLDQQGNERHHKTTIEFNDETPYNVRERVKDGRIFSGGMNEAGWGRLDFIRHNKLKPKYIKNDSLQFKILVKVLHV